MEKGDYKRLANLLSKYSEVRSNTYEKKVTLEELMNEVWDEWNYRNI